MHIAMTRLAQAMAILGATVLCFLIVMTCISIIGRELNATANQDWFETALPGLAAWVQRAGIGPITGDFELIENMMAFSIFAFMPLAQLHSSHATVDVFTSRFPPRLLDWMRAITEVIFAAVLILFAVKLFEGMQGKMRFNETTYLIQFPVWWAYAGAFAASAVAALVGSYCAVMRMIAVITNKPLNWEDAEAEH